MQPIHIELTMALICLVVVPYLFIIFKRMWNMPDDEEHRDERRKIGRRITWLLGFLASLVFILPLMLKFFGSSGNE